MAEITGERPAAAPEPAEKEWPSGRPRLVLLSFLMLFVELALIRWTGSNVLHLSYFSNFVLLGSFLGIGLGFLRADKKTNLFPYAPLALALLIAFVRFFPVEVNRSGDDLIFFGGLNTSGPPRAVVLTVIFVVVAAAMAFIGEGVARAFARFENLEAYRLDVLGSIAGIIAFSALSFLRAPPLVWGSVVGVIFLILNRPNLGTWAKTAIQVGSVAAIVIILGFETFAPNTSWSPYYKVEIEYGENPLINVNGVPHQAIFDGTERNPIYTRVYERARVPLDNVLIVGAGSGNDVGLALRQGAKHVDAVEIDPRLHEIGVDIHPNRPYQDPRVTTHIDDGRAFLERTNNKYDLILFALPDSITLVSGQSSLRLESYLFTKQAMETAQDHLKEGGAFAMYNFYREDWLVDRFANTLEETYDRAPCIDTLGGAGKLAILVDSDDPASLDCETTWTPSSADVASPSTDDYPFPYLRDRSLPAFYLVTIGLILVASLIAVRWVGGKFRPMFPYADLFFMGAAFLLLETKNVVQFALYFGTTWFVNALVFTGVLLSVLAAIEVAKRVRFARPQLLYGLLLVALAVAWLVPGGWILGLPVVPRFIVAVAIAFAPIFLANLVFAQRFRDAAASTSAFGANLLGAMFGGLLEYSALLIGYRMLLVVVAVLYGLAFLLGRKYLVSAAPAAVG